MDSTTAINVITQANANANANANAKAKAKNCPDKFHKFIQFAYFISGKLAEQAAATGNVFDIDAFFKTVCLFRDAETQTEFVLMFLTDKELKKNLKKFVAANNKPSKPPKASKPPKEPKPPKATKNNKNIKNTNDEFIDTMVAAARNSTPLLPTTHVPVPVIEHVQVQVIEPKAIVEKPVKEAKAKVEKPVKEKVEKPVKEPKAKVEKPVKEKVEKPVKEAKAKVEKQVKSKVEKQVKSKVEKQVEKQVEEPVVQQPDDLEEGEIREDEVVDSGATAEDEELECEELECEVDVISQDGVQYLTDFKRVFHFNSQLIIGSYCDGRVVLH